MKFLNMVPGLAVSKQIIMRQKPQNVKKYIGTSLSIHCKYHIPEHERKCETYFPIHDDKRN